MDFLFEQFLIAVLIGWLLIELLKRVVENFAYGTLKMNRDSFRDSLIVFLVVLFAYLIYLYFADKNIKDKMKSSIATYYGIPSNALPVFFIS